MLKTGSRYVATPASVTGQRKEGGAVDGRAAFKRLGFVTLSSNKEDNFKSRELKSVHVDVRRLFFLVSCHFSVYMR